MTPQPGRRDAVPVPPERVSWLARQVRDGVRTVTQARQQLWHWEREEDPGGLLALPNYERS